MLNEPGRREYREFNPKTIMVAIDFEGEAYGPISYAKQLARRLSAKLLLVHVVPQSEAANGNLAQLMNEAEERLQRHVSAIAFDGIPNTMIVRSGDIRETVLDLVADRSPDLLVIGTRCDTRDSTAESLLRSAPCPVLTVGLHARSNAYESTHSQSILLPTDFTQVSSAALAYAESLAKHLGGRLLILHAEETQGLDRSAQFRALTKQLRYPSIISECITLVGAPSDVVTSVAAEKHVDFIVMGVHGDTGGTQGRNGTAFEVIRRSRCPVFTLLTGVERNLTEAEEFRLQQERLARSAHPSQVSRD